MTREDIIRMADEAGAKQQGADLWGGPNIGAVTTYWLEQFAAKIAAAERKACAEICEGWPERREPDGQYVSDPYACAIAIRGRDSNA